MSPRWSGRSLLSAAIGFLALSAISTCGSWVARAFGLPIPGPVIGLLALLFLLAIAGRVPNGLRLAAEILIRHLNLFYIPAAVGVAAYASILRTDLLPICVALLPGTWLALVVVATAFRALAPNEPHADDNEGTQ